MGAPLRRSLVDSVVEPPPPRKELLDSSHFSGPKPRNKGAPPAKHTDEVVLEVRRLREQCRAKTADIVGRLTDAGVEITKDDVARYVAYQTRAHLVPSEGAEPYIQPTATAKELP